MKYLDPRRHQPLPVGVIIGFRSGGSANMSYKEVDVYNTHVFSSIEDLGITLKILSFAFFGYWRITPGELADLLDLD